MDKIRGVYLASGLIFLLIGFSYLLSSFTGLTGFIVSEDLDFQTKSFTGIAFSFSLAVDIPNN